MEAYDLEVGPIQQTFDSLFKSISQYFNSAQVEPEGSIKEVELSYYSQDELRKALRKILEHYNFDELPSYMRIMVQDDSEISAIRRSDDITTYDEKMSDGSHRTYNFYHDNGPESMKASYYWLDKKHGSEQTQGILTTGDRWYLRITTEKENIYYLRMERSTANW